MDYTSATEDHRAMRSITPSSHWQRSVPALTLVLVAPLLAEVLPGATRFSALFVFPIEMCVWGGGALLIRYAVRRGRLGWLNMLLLAIALSIAEECLIQQTSLAPMVLQLKGQVYGRALEVNYVYFLWALVYEAVFVVFLPVCLVELIFPNRREDSWVSRAGLVAVISFFVLGSYLAWYTWTQIARPNVFHVPAYDPPPEAILLAAVAIGVLFLWHLVPFDTSLRDNPRRWSPLRPGCSARRGHYGRCYCMALCCWPLALPHHYLRRQRSSSAFSWLPVRCCFYRDGRPIPVGTAAINSP